MSTLSFKFITCPKGIACPHLDCLFKHPDEDEHGVRKCNVPPQRLEPAPVAAPPADVITRPSKQQKTLDALSDLVFNEPGFSSQEYDPASPSWNEGVVCQTPQDSILDGYAHQNSSTITYPNRMTSNFSSVQDPSRNKVDSGAYVTAHNIHCPPEKYDSSSMFNFTSTGLANLKRKIPSEDLVGINSKRQAFSTSDVRISTSESKPRTVNSTSKSVSEPTEQAACTSTAAANLLKEQTPIPESAQENINSACISSCQNTSKAKKSQLVSSNVKSVSPGGLTEATLSSGQKAVIEASCPSHTKTSGSNPLQDTLSHQETPHESAMPKQGEEADQNRPATRDAENATFTSKSTAKQASKSGQKTVTSASHDGFRLEASADDLPSLNNSTSGPATLAMMSKSCFSSSQTQSFAPRKIYRKPEALNPRLVTPTPAAHDKRLKLLKLYHQELKRLNTELLLKGKEEQKSLALSDQELIWRALDDEQEITKKGPVYLNIMKHRVVELKRMDMPAYAAQLVERKKFTKNRPKQAANGKPIVTGLTPAQELEIVQRLVAPQQKLASYGYVYQVPSELDVVQAKLGVEAAKGWEKCERCQTRFQVFLSRDEETGALTNSGSCTFHYGRSYYPHQNSQKNDASRPAKRWRCCQEDIGDSLGCTSHDCHVFKTSDPKRLSVVTPFSETPNNPQVTEMRAYCFDCEMVYTVHGLELARLTVTTWPFHEIALDILVKPKGPILDLNSRFSGIFPEDITNAEKWSNTTLPPVGSTEVDPDARARKGLKIVESLEAARTLFYSIINPETILIGHGLENDLNACRMVHHKVVDTAIVFPHPRGLPLRYGLKSLASQHLGLTIQIENDGKGHDSAEDARAAGELVRLKVKQTWENMQAAGWKIVDGEFVAPKL